MYKTYFIMYVHLFDKKYIVSEIIFIAGFVISAAVLVVAVG